MNPAGRRYPKAGPCEKPYSGGRIFEMALRDFTMFQKLSAKSRSSMFICVSLVITQMSNSQIASRELLNHLQGQWVMTGDVLGKPVQYTAEGTWILGNQWFCLHMKDTATPPAYEASLFIGLDSAKNEYVAHWLDSFGGAGARVVGTAPLSAEKVEIEYPYAESKFRNIFTHDPPTDEWFLQIESERTGGTWTHFAKYDLKRR